MSEQAALPARSRALTVAAGSVLTGSIQVRGDVLVQGVVRGDVVLLAGSLFIEPGGRVEGDVVADGIRVAGSVQGLCAADHVLILPGGELCGTAFAATLSIEPGGRLLGQSSLRAVQAGFRFAAEILLRPAPFPARRACPLRGWPLLRRRCPALPLLLLATVGVAFYSGLSGHRGARPSAVGQASAPLVSLAPAAVAQTSAPLAVHTLAPPGVVARRLAPPRASASATRALAVTPPAVPTPLAAPRAAPLPRPSSATLAQPLLPAILPKTPMPAPAVVAPRPQPAPAPSVSATVSEIAWLEAVANLQGKMLNQAIMQSTQIRQGVVGRQRSGNAAALADALMRTRKLLRKYGGSQTVAPYVFAASGSAPAQADAGSLAATFAAVRARAAQISLHADSRQVLDGLSAAFAGARN